MTCIQSNLFQAITKLATGSGSKGKRLESALECYVYKLLGSKIYLESISKESANLYKKIDNIYKATYADAYKKFEQVIGRKPDFNIHPLRFLHYKKAHKIIKLIIEFYESICRDLYD